MTELKVKAKDIRELATQIVDTIGGYRTHREPFQKSQRRAEIDTVMARIKSWMRFVEVKHD